MEAVEQANALSVITDREDPVDGREHRLFRSLDVHATGTVTVAELLDALASMGLDREDARLRQTMQALRDRSRMDVLTYPEFCDAIRPNILLIEQALQGTMVVPDFRDVTLEIERLFHRVERNRAGKVADYIPQLARVNPEQFGVALCSVDGQRFAVGDALVPFCVQSCHKPVNYCLALEELGPDEVHDYIGREPSGRSFNEMTLTKDGQPHNPMINAGAIMSTALVRRDLPAAERFEFVLDRWRALCGSVKPGFNNAVYQSERQSADRNFALGYYMREHGAFPPDVDLLEVLEFYFQCCSIEVTAEMMATLTATLANGGVCPTTGERVFATETVQHCLSLMCSCGMYDFSGEFAFAVGLPAKSGVGGGILVVVPNVMGFCVWSPRLDENGNSVRGVEFCRELVRTFAVHNYDSLTGGSSKRDPRSDRIHEKAARVGELIWAASKGDSGAIHRMLVRGGDQDVADYDRRTPLHLAAAEGRMQVVEYLVGNGADVNPVDRWGGTPLDDALRHRHVEVAQYLEARGARRGDVPVNAVTATAAIAPRSSAESGEIIEMIYAASEGDLAAIRRLVARGVHPGGADYDKRTPLHLAAAEGHEEVVTYFLAQGVPAAPKDRWGGTPVEDARRHGHQRVVDLFE